MRIYFVMAPYGVLAIGEDQQLVDHEPFPKSVDETVEEMLTLERGEAPSAVMRLAERFKGAEIVIEDEALAAALSRAGHKVVVERQPIFRSTRERLAELGASLGLFGSEEEMLKWIREVSVEYTRRKLRAAAAKRDLLAVQSIRAIDDIDKIINLLATRVREWHAVHFPELGEIVKEHEEFVRIVSEMPHRDDLSQEALEALGIKGQKAERILEAAKNSLGSDISEGDAEAIATLAKIVRDLYDLRARLTLYINEVMEEVAPNVTALVGPLLGARLLSLAGSLEDMAKMPASTIQVLGAEKALFRALRTGGRPPKHGVIFQFPEINKSPKWQRGKIARALAAKLSIAAKVDAYTGRLIGEKLKEELQKRIEEIKRVYASPPVREQKPQQRPPKRKEGRRRFRR